MIENKQAGLYIHIPFCLSKCGYCSFYSVASPELIPEFIKAVSQEMAFYEKSFQSFDTIYLGGGTPSLLSMQQIDDLLKSAKDHFNIDRQAEITMEVNPGDVSAEYFQQLRKRGINRLNIGIQSFNDSLLKFLGRRHSAGEAVCAIDAARTAGFGNIGLDLIYGVYGQDMKTWKETLNKALSFLPEHLSCYQLSPGEKTPLFARCRSDGLRLPTENEALDFFLTTSKILTDAGYIHYEVSNFARTDALKSKHNMKYWRHIPYLGLGPAAHSFCDRRRWWNKADVKAYLKAVGKGKKPQDKSESLSMEQLALEALFLSMRTKDGIHLRQYKNRYGSDLLVEKKPILDVLIHNKLVVLKDGYLQPTLAGMAVADSLALI
ncbi:MAG TPA: radical SAM family heme chaperone HemW [Smithellaceae bacterium]|nr:radical SAM family heme chaperone HemW [Smithellaceae bacterium]HRV44943.1 radical SAM family heme chaperone HemW [Smithellaceae bacterium]